MMPKRPLSAAVLVSMSLATGGCTTFSFAPPNVDTDFRTRATSVSDCTPDRILKRSSGGYDTISKDVEGALDLIDNFVVTYRCATREAADGRQIFEVPSLLALVTAGIGGSFGLSDDGRLAAASGAFVYNRANSYYAPQAKAAMLDSALDAVICIKTSAVGVGFFDTRAPNKNEQLIKELTNAIASLDTRIKQKDSELLQLGQNTKDALTAAEQFVDSLPSEDRNALLSGREIKDILADPNIELPQELSAIRDQLKNITEQATRVFNEKENLVAERKGLADALELAKAEQTSAPKVLSVSKETGNGTIEIDVPRQYFELVAGGLLSVERVLARRLSAAGTLADPQSLATELAALAEQYQELEDEEDETEDAEVDDQLKGMAVVDGERKFGSLEEKNEKMVEIQIDQLKTNIHQCVVRAKL